MSAPKKESARFTIVNGDTTISFNVNGSTVAAIVEAFGWLPPERRAKVMERLARADKKLRAADAKHAAEGAGGAA